jgi:hypothetical protein
VTTRAAGLRPQRGHPRAGTCCTSTTGSANLTQRTTIATGKNSREAASASRGFASGTGYRDPFDLFGKGGGAVPPAAAPGRRLGKLERAALADLDLYEDADATRIRARYTELVKLCHPDANGGDRSAETKLQRTIRAYQVLRKAKLA